MLASLSQKMELAQGVLDGNGDLAAITLRGGRQALLKRLEQVMSAVPTADASIKAPPADPAADFAARATRPLLPAGGRPVPPPLTAEERARVEGLRALAARRRRAAQALLAEDLAEEAQALNRSAELAEAEADDIQSGNA